MGTFKIHSVSRTAECGKTGAMPVSNFDSEKYIRIYNFRSLKCANMAEDVIGLSGHVARQRATNGTELKISTRIFCSPWGPKSLESFRQVFDTRVLSLSLHAFLFSTRVSYMDAISENGNAYRKVTSTCSRCLDMKHKYTHSHFRSITLSIGI